MEKVEKPLAAIRALEIGESMVFPMSQRNILGTIAYTDKYITGNRYTLKKERGADVFTVTRIK